MSCIGNIFAKLFKSAPKSALSKTNAAALKNLAKAEKEIAKQNLKMQGIYANLDQLNADLFTKSAKLQNKLT